MPDVPIDPVGRARIVTALVALGAGAFLFRLAPVLRGGGLRGLGNYDDGVYFAAAVGLVDGRLPYRDFLLLHPPGIAILLAPFGFLAHLVGDANGFAAARLAWMALGGVNAILVWAVLRPAGRWSAAVGGCCYAVFLPAVYMEHSTSLEAPATTVLLIAILLLQSRRLAAARWAQLAAGFAVGLSAGIKIWGVVTVLIVVGWLLAGRRFRVAGTVLAGAGLACLLLIGPFFAMAPRSMWDDVVRDQLDRPHDHAGTLHRLADLAGISGPAASHPLIAGGTVLVLAVLCCAVAWTVTTARLGVLLLIGLGILLVLTPSFFFHYSGLTAAPAALTVGAAGGRMITVVGRRPLGRLGLGILAATLAAVTAATSASSTLGRSFPGRAFDRAVSSAAVGCVTADDPAALLLTNTLNRNLRAGCPLVVDLGGYSHDLWATGGTEPSRTHNAAFQRLAVRYLGSGSRAVIIRFAENPGFDRATRATLARWELLARAGRFQVLRPPSPAHDPVSR